MSVSSINSLLVVLSAPSGGGKTTVCQQLLASRAGLSRAITCTTRPPRPGEIDGVDYYFLSLEEFDHRVEAGEFLEHATVYGNRYGTLKAEVLGRLRQGTDVILSVDVQGVATIRAKARADAEMSRALVTVFLCPRSIEVLAERLSRRGADAPEVIARRLNEARQEIEHWAGFDYLVISGSIPDDLARMQSILDAEKLRVSRALPPLSTS